MRLGVPKVTRPVSSCAFGSRFAIFSATGLNSEGSMRLFTNPVGVPSTGEIDLSGAIFVKSPANIAGVWPRTRNVFVCASLKLTASELAHGGCSRQMRSLENTYVQ